MSSPITAKMIAESYRTRWGKAAGERAEEEYSRVCDTGRDDPKLWAEVVAILQAEEYTDWRRGDIVPPAPPKPTDEVPNV